MASSAELDRLSQAGRCADLPRHAGPRPEGAVEDQIEGEGKTRAPSNRGNAARVRELEVEAQGAQNWSSSSEKRVSARPGLESASQSSTGASTAWAPAGASSR